MPPSAFVFLLVPTLLSAGPPHDERPETVRTLHPESIIYAVAFSPDGRRVATSGDDRSVRVWDVRTGKEVRRWAERQFCPRQLVFGRDGKTLFALKSSCVLRQWDVATGKEGPRFGGSVYRASCALSPDGTQAATVQNATLVVVRDLRGAEVTHRLTIPAKLAEGSPAWEVVFAPDGKAVLATRAAEPFSFGREPSERLCLWELAGKAEVRTFLVDGTPGGVQINEAGFSPDGRLVVVAAKGGLQLWQARTGKHMQTLAETAQHFAFSPDGKMLATTGKEGSVRLWETATWKVIRRWEEPAGPIWSLTFSPDGRTLALGTNGSTLLLWDVLGRAAGDRKPVRPEDWRRLWEDLASDDAAQACRAQRAFAADPREAVRHLEEQLRAVARPCPPERLSRLLADLDARRFAVRRQAEDELSRLGRPAVPVLRRALEGKPSLEVRRRVEALLEGMENAGRFPERLRVSRAIGLLERLGTPEAHQALARLARGPAESAVTEEARAATTRLARVRAGHVP
jgi:WD40 repeat protein